MLDIDPRLDSKLQAFFEHIEASTPPSGLTNIEVAAPHRGSRTFNLFAGLAAAAVVAASVAVFAVELRDHHTPAPGPAVTSSPPPATPSASALKKMPLLGTEGVPLSAHVVIPVTHGQGSVQLQTFVPQGTLYYQFDCAGPGPFKIISSNHLVGNSLLECSGSFGVTTITVESPKLYDDKPLTFEVTADRSMTWEIFIAESRAPLHQFTVQPDERVLVPLTYGTGSITLPTFTVERDEWLNIQEACNSGGGADTVKMVGNTYFGSNELYQCSFPDGATGGFGSGPPGGGGSGPVSVHVTADPSINWEILITEGPTDLGVPSSADVGVAPAAYGMGPGSLPAFTPTQTYSVAFVCSGVGSLTIVSPSFTHTATPTCGGSSDYFTPPGQVPGQPVSLSVAAPASVGWEIFIYQDNGSAAESCPAVWIPAGTPAQQAASRARNAAVCAQAGR
jgi:hypothetical protein